MKDLRPRRLSRSPVLVLLAAVLPLGGCCTSALWGCTATDTMLVGEAKAKEGKGNFLFDSHASWSALQIGKRVALTPLALAFDFFTLPNQVGEAVLGPSRRKRKALQSDVGV